MVFEIKGAIFDLDGVITATAKIHSKAWKKVFDEFLKNYYIKNNMPFVEFDIKDYLCYVDGKPREKGVIDFLNSRKIKIPYGFSKDSPKKITICGISKKKNLEYKKILKKDRPTVFKNSITLIKKMKKRGLKIAVATSSKNCTLVLRLAGIEKLFDAQVDGNTSKKANLKGKPNPDIFVYAAKKLGLHPTSCAVFEDAVSGVDAGKKGNFGLVVGVDRYNSGLKADIVVKDLGELTLKKIDVWFKKELNKACWKLKYDFFNKNFEKTRESLTVIGNGYFGTRGCHELKKDSPKHYPGTYIAGIYDETFTNINGKKARNNDLVNCPNWLLMELFILGKRIDPFEETIIDYNEELDMKKGVLSFDITFMDKEGRKTRIKSERFASMKKRHLCGIKFSVIPLNYSEKITIVSALDGNVKNNNVARYRELNSKHLEIISQRKINSSIQLISKTKKSKHTIFMSAKNNCSDGILENKKIIRKDGFIGEEFKFRSKKNKPIVIEKIVSIRTSRDTKNPKKTSLSEIFKKQNFDVLLKESKKEWVKIHKKANILINGDRMMQIAMHLHAYHLLVTFSNNSKGLDIGLPARGLHGEAYRGHVFWDEIYIQKFFEKRFPPLTKEALLYRYNRLDKAKEYAKRNEYKGAMFPWQSADTGEEETQEIHYNPVSKKWGPDNSMLQRHVSIAVFYNFYNYIQKNNDLDFLEKFGFEVMVEIARFWKSISLKDKKGKYHINDVMGPDEFHEKYSNRKKAGIDDNAYTNIMVSWLLSKTINLCKKVSKKNCEKFFVYEEEINEWENMSKNLYLPMKKGIIMQFLGFEKLKEINFETYKNKYKNISRMDRILKAEGKNPNDYKIIKQADMLMVFYLLSFKEVKKVLTNLGLNINDIKKFVKKHYDYYIKFTTHGSTLSKFVHGAIAIKLGDKKDFWFCFKDAIIADLLDIQEGTTAEGIHTGLMAGTINLVDEYFPFPKYFKNLEK